jgi:hypothetical protein
VDLGEGCREIALDQIGGDAQHAVARLLNQILPLLIGLVLHLVN